MKFNNDNNIIFFDVETDNGKVVLIGVMDLTGNYLYFTDAIEFWNYLKKNKIRKVYAYNLEFDFFVLFLQKFELLNKRINVYMNVCSVVYIQVSNIYFYDLALHFSGGLKEFGKLVGLLKKEYDYKNMELNDKLIDYNKRDLELTRNLYLRLSEIYKQENLRVKATISSNAIEIYNKKFLGIDYKKISETDLDLFRKAYKGGWCETFAKGKYRGKFYYVDVNSLYPYVMLDIYPYPYKYIKFEQVYNLDYKEILNKVKNNFWIAICQDVNSDNYAGYNNIENEYSESLHNITHFLFIFEKFIYPFKYYIEYFNRKKEFAEQNNDFFARSIYKRLMNSLYGRFAMKSFSQKVLFNIGVKDIYKMKNLVEYEQLADKVFLVKEKRKMHYEVNVVWSVFVCARARKFMFDMYNIFRSRGIEIYYVDTDGFIISGDLDKIKEFFDNKKIGFFKIVRQSSEIEILGKKIYRMDNNYKVKGIEGKNAKEFFENGETCVERLIKWRSALRKNVQVGSVYIRKIENIKNI